MSKKSVCENNESFAYWSGLGGVEFKHIEHGTTDYIYCVANAWHGKKSYHKLKVYHGKNHGYLKLHGYTIWLYDCINMK